MSSRITPSTLGDGAVLVVRPELDTFVVTGPDAKEWLNGLVTCDVKNLGAGQGAYGLALTKQGKIQADLNVIVGEDAIYVSVPNTVSSALKASLMEFLIMEDADLDDQSGAHVWMTLHGQRALDAARAAVSPSEGKYASVDWTGLGGAAVVVRREHADAVRDRLLTEHGVLGASREEWEPLRIALLVPEFGTDFGPEDNPHEASLDRRAVSWSKGCYLGQEVVCMQDMRGKVKRRIVTLDAAGEGLSRGTKVRANGTDVGEITSVGEGRGSTVQALARLTTKAIDGKAALEAGGVALTVSRLPA